MKYFVLILICAAINSLDDTDDGYRRQYGFSFHKNCGNYFITFKCLTACKSMGFQVFRLDYKCKCTCHELKTTSILPAFVWRTNGTTKKLPATFSPKLYAIVGTMSPPPIETDRIISVDKDQQENVSASQCPPLNDTNVTTNVTTSMTTNVTNNVTTNVTTNVPSKDTKSATITTSSTASASDAKSSSNPTENATVAATIAATTAAS